jgi:antitoxin component YwqK of YwqJK toxin-antitoxin module
MWRYLILSIECDCINGRCFEFYESGELWAMCWFVDNEKNGYYQEFYENGNIKVISNFINNVLAGEYTEYTEYKEDGSIETESFIINLSCN